MIRNLPLWHLTNVADLRYSTDSRALPPQPGPVRIFGSSPSVRFFLLMHRSETGEESPALDMITVAIRVLHHLRNPLQLSRFLISSATRCIV